MKQIIQMMLLMVRLGSGAWILQQGYEKLTGGFSIYGLIPVVAHDHDIPMWYKAFFAHAAAPFESIYQYLIPLGEIAIGLGLTFGLLVRTASFFGIVLMLNYILSDMIFTYPIQLFGFVLLVMAPWPKDFFSMQPVIERVIHGTYSRRR